MVETNLQIISELKALFPETFQDAGIRSLFTNSPKDFTRESKLSMSNIVHLQYLFEFSIDPVRPNRKAQKKKKNKRLNGKYQTSTNDKRAVLRLNLMTLGFRGYLLESRMKVFFSFTRKLVEPIC